MANELKVAKIHAIIGLLEQHWPLQRIARELGVDRGTVARYDRLRQSAGSKPANVTPGSSLGEPLQFTPFFENTKKLLPSDRLRLRFQYSMSELSKDVQLGTLCRSLRSFRCRSG